MKGFWLKGRSRPAILSHLYHSGDVHLFTRIFVFALVVPALTRLNLARLETLLTYPSTLDRSSDITPHRLMYYVDAAIQLGRPLIRPGCLTRGLTSYYFLRRAAVDVSLCFGIGELDGEFAGHCWLLLDGEPFMEKRDPRLLFPEVFRFPRGSGSMPAANSGVLGIKV